ncbi:hypothetical protein DFH27DRAFT_264402 [Peziza echinospora]|nr:hypothetical protein DFH27DRAFT_264402 [Peziza echinospora]
MCIMYDVCMYVYVCLSVWGVGVGVSGPGFAFAVAVAAAVAAAVVDSAERIHTEHTTHSTSRAAVHLAHSRPETKRGLIGKALFHNSFSPSSLQPVGLALVVARPAAAALLGPVLGPPRDAASAGVIYCCGTPGRHAAASSFFRLFSALLRACGPEKAQRACGVRAFVRAHVRACLRACVRACACVCVTSAPWAWRYLERCTTVLQQIGCGTCIHELSTLASPDRRQVPAVYLEGGRGAWTHLCPFAEAATDSTTPVRIAERALAASPASPPSSRCLLVV